MRPLRPFVVATVLTMTLLGPTFGQTEAAKPTQAEALVFGDVTRNGVYQFSFDSTPSAADIVKGAGGFDEGAVNIRVIRGGQQVALAARLEPNQKSDFIISNGDIVFVSSEKKLAAPTRGERIRVAVIHPEKAPLLPVVYTNTTVGALLAHKSLQWQNSGFRLIRTHPLAARGPVTKDTTFMPGDVLMIEPSATANRSEAPPATVQTNLPTLNSPKDPETARAATPIITAKPAIFTPDESAQPTVIQTGQSGSESPEPAMANYGGVDSSPAANATRVAPPLLPPAAPSGAEPSVPTLPMPSGTPPATVDNTDLNQDPWLTNTPLKATTTNLQQPVPSETEKELDARINASIPAFNASTSASTPPVTDMANYGSTANYGSATTEPSSDTAPKPPAETGPGTIPLPSELKTETANAGSGATIWYVAGLIGALLVVLGAWVYGSRALAEGPQLRMGKAPQKRPIKKRVKTVTQAPLNGTQPQQVPESSKPPAPVLKPIVPQTGAPAAAAPQPVRQSVVPLSELKPADIAASQLPLGAQPAPPQAPMPVAQVPVAPTTVAPTPVPQPIAPLVPVSEAPVAQDPAAQPTVPMAQMPLPQTPAAPITPASQPLTMSIPMPQPPAQQTEPEIAALPAQTMAAAPLAQPEPIPTPDTQTTRILDALVNNSIPITEQPVQLPTHLEFFGDSQGPRQLRVDPGHTTLKGPHMGLKAGLGSKQTNQASSGELT